MVAETAKQKELRRTVSGKVTNVLNSVDTIGIRLPAESGTNDEIGSMIRRCVLLTLRNIDDRIRMLERDAQVELNLTESQGQLVKFYMKGGNAYSCVVGENRNNNLNNIGGGNSDWDTQVVVNPWLPTPVRSRLHNDIVEVALSEFRQCGEDIAHVVHGYNIDVVLDLDYLPGNETVVHNDSDSVRSGTYVFILDEQQSTRKIFNYDHLGMVFDDKVAMSPVIGTDKKDVPGILLHSAIKPFELYRLGYLGKVYRLNDPARQQSKLQSTDYEEASLLPRKALAELIDITIPRLDTVEAFEVWESLVSHDIQITYAAANVRNLQDSAVNIPLPDINYHKLENLLMLCEMADGSSRHYNKLPKRVNRLIEACLFEFNGNNAAEVKKPLLQMVGVTQENDLLNDQQAAQAINQYLAPHQANLNQHDPQYDNWLDFVRRLMIHVRTIANNNQNNLTSRQWIQNEINKQSRNIDNNVARAVWAQIYNDLAAPKNSHPQRMGDNSNPDVSSVQRYRSDDLAMLDQIRTVAAESHDVNHNPLVNASILKPSTISHWRIIRVDDRGSMMRVFAKFKKNLKAANDPELNFVHRFYTREDNRGHIPECLVIAKKGEKILSVCTIVAGNDARTGYCRSSEVDLDLGKNTLAVLSDIARQRKLTASLIHDYTLKSVLGQHYNLIKQLGHF